MLLKTPRLVTLQIYYYMPDHKHLVQEFVWSYKDVIPELHRTHKFLWYWKNNIEAPVQEIRLGVEDAYYSTYRGVDEILNLN